jgi:hypothetical protein
LSVQTGKSSKVAAIKSESDIPLSLGPLELLSSPQAASKSTLDIAAVATLPRNAFLHHVFINDISPSSFAKDFLFNIYFSLQK